MIDIINKKSNPSDLNRFLEAQNKIYCQVLEELDYGEKISHWMWFVFPQVSGLGKSENSMKYSIKSIFEAKTYLTHDILGTRLRECTLKTISIQDKNIAQIFGHPDDIKFHSSMTLFNFVSESEQIFSEALNRFYNGKEDQLTLEIIHSFID